MKRAKLPRLKRGMKRRKFPRLKEGWALELRAVDSTGFQRDAAPGLALNISCGGLCLETKQEIEPGAMLAIDLYPPSSSFGSPILVLAEALWCRKKLSSDDYEVGAEFRWIGWSDSDAHQKLVDYIRHRASGDRGAKPIWEVFDEIMATIPDEELRKLPTDGARELDHYLYGSRKREA